MIATGSAFITNSSPWDTGNELKNREMICTESLCHGILLGHAALTT